MSSSQSASPDLHFLAGGGDMGARIRAFDWGASSLGEPSTWRPSLKAIVRMALTTRHPIFVFWGPQRICLYNDAYAASLGPEKHPAILGMPATLAWQEIWPIIGPQIEMVERGEGATWNENQLVPILRHGELQDVYWTYSYGPIDDEQAPNGVGGVLVICTETTQQVMAERKLGAERARFAQLFEQAPTFMAMLRGPQHVIELANPAYMQLIAHRDVLNKPVAQALPETVEQGFVPLLDQVYRSGEAFVAASAPYVGRTADGVSFERYVDFVYQPIRDDANLISGIFVVGVDMTQRRAAELALRDSDEQLRLATEAAEIGLWDVDIVSGTLYWPARVKAMFGISPDVPVTMADFYAGLHPDELPSTSASFANAMDPQRRAVYDVEYRTIGKEDGVVRWIAAKGRGVFDSAGKCLRVIGTAIDITRRKRVDEQLRELNETLEKRVVAAIAERNLLADLIEGTDAFVQVADLDYRWLAINKASADEFERIFGVRPKAGDSMLQILANQPQHQAAIRSVWGRALNGEAFTTVEEYGDRSGERHFYEMRFNVLRDRQGQRIGAYQFAYDVTERIRDQGRLKVAEDALRQAQKMEAIGQLTGGIAHDFNNLLQAVRGSLELISRMPGDVEKVQRWVQSAIKATARGAKLTAQLLTFSREQAVELRPVAIHDLLRDSEDMLRRALGPQVRLSLALAKEQIAAICDATQLEMAVLNLAINARDAMPEGGALTIATSKKWLGDESNVPAGEYVEIRVTDTGTGMAPEVAQRAFDPFFTTKDVGKGTGLGLSQVYGMTRQAGGTALIESVPGRGSSVSLLLRSAEHLPELLRGTAVRPNGAATLGAAESNGACVLVVDDDDGVRQFLIDSLSTLGYAVVQAKDGPSALRALGQTDPAVMVIDYAMPGMTGAELANAVRATRPDLPLIFATGYADSVAIDRAVGQSAVVVRKPFEISALQTAITHALDRNATHLHAR